MTGAAIGLRALHVRDAGSRFGHFARHLQQSVHEHVRTRTDAKGPIPPEPSAGQVVGRRRTHHARQEGTISVQRSD